MLQAAMYGEMAATASGHRPVGDRKTDWDVALKGAIRFIGTAGLDEWTARRLLQEAATLRAAGERNGLVSVESTCQRLASEFRHRIRTR